MRCSSYSSDKYSRHEKFPSRASVAGQTFLNEASLTKIHSKLVLESLLAYELGGGFVVARSTALPRPEEGDSPQIAYEVKVISMCPHRSFYLHGL